MYIPSSLKRSVGIPLLPSTPNVSLDAAGLVALADLTTIQERTVLTGTATFLDAFVICPGIHMQQKSTNLNGGEHPVCANMKTGDVFRIENPATVFYLQQVSKTGHLTKLMVSQLEGDWWSNFFSMFFTSQNASIASTLAYGTAVLWTISVVILLACSYDWWGLVIVLVLMAARLCNVIVVRRRATPGWSGAKEGFVTGDLLVLLSQDRWVRIQGKVDHLKAVTSGQWLRDQRDIEGWMTALATLAVYLAAALVSNATQFGKILILALLGGSAGLLAVANSTTKNSLVMHGHILEVDGNRRKYDRRRELARQLVSESPNYDWAISMGLIKQKDISELLEPKMRQ
ncbi:hypothetical protein CEP54_005311 [Fusarium duplospermum]|uniref:Uncharacterized protein n=1 Tax=Fusarium duplospermum TaxID=1325734 RepID=A0A428QD41_9HYPO|nr:hypothetical protein CEP54_005311 [Fusarium duplospermum]